jgi:hypothetical protein
MRGTNAAIVGVLCFVAAGFIQGAGRNSPDPELVLAAFYALAACGLLGILAGGVAMGIRLARD